MSRIWLPGGGGGGDSSDDCTIILPNIPKGFKAITADSDDEAKEGTLDTDTSAADSHVLAGETYMKFNRSTGRWEKRTGAQANRGAWTGSVAMNGSVVIPAGYHNGAGKVNGPAVTQRGAWTSRIGVNGRVAIPAGYHNGSGYVDQAITNRGAWTGTAGRNSRITVPEGYHNGSGYVNGPSMTDKGAATYTPGRSNQSIGAGHYLTGAQTILGDANLLAHNIRDGVTLFGTKGNFQGYSSSPLYLFKTGTGFQNLQTTGLTLMFTDGIWDIAPNSYYLSFQTNKLKPSNTHILARLNTAVNLTSYNYLNIEFRSVNNAWQCSGGVSTSSSITSKNSLTALTNISSRGLLKVDISALSGNHFIYWGTEVLQHSSSTYVDISNIFLSSA